MLFYLKALLSLSRPLLTHGHLYAAGMKIQREREQNRQALLSDQDLPTNSRFAQSAGLPPFRAMKPARPSTFFQPWEASKLVGGECSPGLAQERAAPAGRHGQHGAARPLDRRPDPQGSGSGNELQPFIPAPSTSAGMGPARWSDAHPNQLVRAHSATSPILRPRGSEEH